MNSTLPQSHVLSAAVFILIGVPGLVMFVVSSFLLCLHGEVRAALPSPLVTGPLACVGALLALYGLGKWRQWRYLLVFLCFFVSLCTFLRRPALTWLLACLGALLSLSLRGKWRRWFCLLLFLCIPTLRPDFWRRDLYSAAPGVIVFLALAPMFAVYYLVKRSYTSERKHAREQHAPPSESPAPAPGGSKAMGGDPHG